MYIPNEFEITDKTIINAFIDNNPFAILTSCNNGKIEVTHIPILRLSDGKLYGHVSKQNNHSCIEEKNEVCCVFSGDDAYISPRYYESEFNVPTWNYSAVHIYGKLKYIDEKERVWSLLEKSTEFFEEKNGWKLPQNDKYKALVEFIRFFEIDVTHTEAKFKLSQNKPDKDIEKVVISLKTNNQNEMAKLMEKYKDKK